MGGRGRNFGKNTRTDGHIYQGDTLKNTTFNAKSTRMFGLVWRKTADVDVCWMARSRTFEETGEQRIEGDPTFFLRFLTNGFIFTIYLLDSPKKC